MSTIHDLFLIIVRPLRRTPQGAPFCGCSRKSSRPVSPRTVLVRISRL
uniref:Uncharacterized protein n=1 Tax=Pseudomonas sp. (strain WBC-3) TaxID=165468 RepID=A0A0A0RF73_PSEWB|nr:hypothetical protein WBC3-000020 [Pseudomonas sp. WBC-3]